LKMFSALEDVDGRGLEGSNLLLFGCIRIPARHIPLLAPTLHSCPFDPNASDYYHCDHLDIIKQPRSELQSSFRKLDYKYPADMCALNMHFQRFPPTLRFSTLKLTLGQSPHPNHPREIHPLHVYYRDLVVYRLCTPTHI
jgi:hypothetical protein